MNERYPATILGHYIGTVSGGYLDKELLEIFRDFEPDDGFDMPISEELFVNYSKGKVSSYDEAGNEIVTKDLIIVINGFVARQHHNKKAA